MKERQPQITCAAHTATSVAHSKADYGSPDFHFQKILRGATFSHQFCNDVLIIRPDVIFRWGFGGEVT